MPRHSQRQGLSMENIASSSMIFRTSTSQYQLDSTPTCKSGLLHIFRKGNWLSVKAEVKRPFLLLYANGEFGDELVYCVNLGRVEVDLGDSLQRLLERPNVFALYSPEASFVFKTDTEKTMLEWVSVLDPLRFSLIAKP